MFSRCKSIYCDNFIFNFYSENEKYSKESVVNLEKEITYNSGEEKQFSQIHNLIALIISIVSLLLTIFFVFNKEYLEKFNVTYIIIIVGVIYVLIYYFSIRKMGKLASRGKLLEIILNKKYKDH